MQLGRDGSYLSSIVMLSSLQRSPALPTPSARCLVPATTHPPWTDGRYRVPSIGPPYTSCCPSLHGTRLLIVRYRLQPPPGMGCWATQVLIQVPASFRLASSPSWPPSSSHTAPDYGRPLSLRNGQRPSGRRARALALQLLLFAWSDLPRPETA